jgi:hypothetical protein
MQLVWNIIGLLASGSVAVKILHFDADPTYLMLFFGWTALAFSFIELGMLVNALSELGSTKTEQRQ